MIREIIVTNKKTGEKEIALFKVVNNLIWFLSNNVDFSGAWLSDIHKTNKFKYSWILSRAECPLSKYKSFKEFEKIEKLHFDILFCGNGKKYKFHFVDEPTNNFKEINL